MPTSKSDTQMPTFAALIFVGPGELDAKRLLNSLIRYEPTVQTIVIIDDNSKQNFDVIVPAKATDRTVILPSPRNGRGYWWQGGLCVGLTEGLRWIGENRTVDFVVRLDTDALVISPFADRVSNAFDADSKIGLLGTWDKYAFNGAQRLPHEHTNKVLPDILKKASRPFAIWRHSECPTRIQCSLFKNDRLVRSIIHAAIQNGYQLGDFLQGSGYAICGRLVLDLSTHRLTASPLAFLHQFYGEDVLATLFCYAMDYYPQGCNQPGEVFGVGNQRLPATIPELLEAQYGVVHSIKEL
jgi:glycosyltransferase involved in cell wall biosynthesis